MHGRRFVRSMYAGGLAALASVPIMAAVSPVGASADTSMCPDYRACLWRYDNYNGDRFVIDPDQWSNDIWYGSGTHHSAKNHFLNRTIKIGNSTSDGVNVVACLDAGEVRPDPGYFEVFKILGGGNQCPH